MPTAPPSRRTLAGVALVSGSLLMTELALTRIFRSSCITTSPSGDLDCPVRAQRKRRVRLHGTPAAGSRRDRHAPARQSVISALRTIAALFVLVRLQVGLNYSRATLH
jgi:hypothetical protein